MEFQRQLKDVRGLFLGDLSPCEDLMRLRTKLTPRKSFFKKDMHWGEHAYGISHA